MGLEGLVIALVYLLIAGGLIYVVFWGLGKLALPEPARVILIVIAVIILLLWFVRNVLPQLNL